MTVMARGRGPRSSAFLDTRTGLGARGQIAATRPGRKDGLPDPIAAVLECLERENDRLRAEVDAPRSEQLLDSANWLWFCKGGSFWKQVP